MTSGFLLFAVALVGLHLWCIVDVARNWRRLRRPLLWVIVLLIVPLGAPIGYLLSKSRRVSAARTKTFPSELAMANRYAHAGQYELAIPHYRAADPTGRDGYIGYRLAYALYRSGDPTAALTILDTMGPVPIQHDPEFVPLLRAKVLVALDRKEEAAAIYGATMPRPPSHAVFYDYADLLLNLGRHKDAKIVLEEIERRERLPPGGPVDRPSEQSLRAKAQLAELRARS